MLCCDTLLDSSQNMCINTWQCSASGDNWEVGCTTLNRQVQCAKPYDYKVQEKQQAKRQLPDKHMSAEICVCKKQSSPALKDVVGFAGKGVHRVLV